MRLWTLHPKYLDPQGLVALWREALLAQKVLSGATKGYRHHPQLIRFRQHPAPLAAMAAYLGEIHLEALERGYSFDAAKIGQAPPAGQIEETMAQLLFEWAHLKVKLKARNPKRLEACQGIDIPEAHPLFEIVTTRAGILG